MSKRGLLLVAHGSRDPAWIQPFERIAERLTLEGMDEATLALSYLEHAKPDPMQAARSLVQQGCTDVAVLPMFLGTGMHAREDMRKLLVALTAEHAGVRVHLHPSLGEWPDVLDAVVTTALRTWRS